MSKKREVMRKYNLSDAQLKQFADQLVILINRDITYFEMRNFTPAKLTEFKTAINAFENISADVIMEGNTITATEEKNAARTTLIIKLRTALLMAKFVFGQHTPQYRSFGDADYTEQTDEKLYRNAQLLIRACTDYLADLAPEGMTTQLIADIKAARIAFDNAIDQQYLSNKQRDIMTSLRINTGNALYDLLVKYTEIGKDIWYAVKEAHYNDYIIY